MFNVVGQWHPLRLAEDFAMLHNLSGGRGILGVGRGTVPREMLPLTAGRVSVGSYDNPSAAEADRVNREVTDESLNVLRLAMEQETFSYSGKHFCLPPPGIPDRGGEVAELTLVPVADVRDGHDEFWRFLAPYGWGRGYLGPDGHPAHGDFVPTLADSMSQGPWAVGTAADVAEAIGVLDDLLGLTDLVIFPAMPGDAYARAKEQMTRFAEEVFPLLPTDNEVTT
jgi:alkanesulfonate monooxygenase SsuD/methylene tetrahydromethanopterin reductase-like flavin-dependent oxidoreductase (luciferase family)